MSTAHAVFAGLGAAGDIPAPTIEYDRLAPLLIVFTAAVLGVLVEAFVPRRARYGTQLALAVLAILGSFGTLVWVAGGGAAMRGISAEGAIAIDGPALFLQGTVLLISLLALGLIAERSLESGQDAFTAQAAALPGSEAERQAISSGFAQTEVFPLTMFAVSGMMLFPAANDLLTAFVALEVMSLPLYLLCGLARRRRLLSQEAALKYFLLGAFSSAFFLYGVALLYGYAGSIRLADIAAATSASSGNDVLLLVGIAMLSVGLLFKVGAVPFHAWTPDVYQGAPTPVTAFMAAATKVAAFGALTRIFYLSLAGVKWDWQPVFWAIAIVTMVVGAVVAITQTDIKRMLAYSSIAHAGFILTGLIAANKQGLSSTMFYLAAYGFVTLGAFAVVTLVRDAAGEVTDMARWAGLGKRSPLVATVFALFLLAFAGIPLTSGFTGKFAVFSAAVSGGATPLVVVGVLSSAAAAFFYVRVIVLMFFTDPPENAPEVTVPSALTTSVIAVGAAVTVVLGVLPQPVLDLADQASQFMR